MHHPHPTAVRRLRARLLAACFALAPLGLKAEEAPLLLQHPTISADSIAFAYGDDLWIVPRAGGVARRLATANGRLDRPFFSPDGRWVAFTGTIEGNTDVYVIPAAGGEIRRLTWHPGVDVTLGWTPDGKSILFSSDRASFRDLLQLYTIPMAGGPAAELPLPSGTEACYSPDGLKLAYVPFPQWQPEWKGYRGGQTTPIWVADLSDSSVIKIPRENCNYHCPMWIGDRIYFVSDRDGRYALFSADPAGRRVRKLRDNTGFDIKSASAGAGVIVYSQLDALHVFDPATGGDTVVPVRISDDLPRRQAHFQKIDPDQIEAAAISPTGKRALFDIRGQILSVPAEKGDVRNLTHAPGVANRDAAWSPDGKEIAYFSDETGEYSLEIRSPSGLDLPRRIDLGSPPSFFYSPLWSPDSSKIAYTDKRLNLWVIDAAGGAPVRVDTTPFEEGEQIFDPSWSPDSKWLAYAKELSNHMRAIFIYSFADKTSRQLTDGLSDAGAPRFDRSGKYLYFTASTTAGLNNDDDMWSDEHPVTANVYVAVLRKDLPSPVAPESDEENAPKSDDDSGETKKPDASADKSDEGKKDEADKAATKPPKPTRIDFEGLDQRIVVLPIPQANFNRLEAGPAGVLFASAQPDVEAIDEEDEHRGVTLTRFDLKDRKPVKLAEGISRWQISADGKKILYYKDKAWFLTDAGAEIKPGKGGLKINSQEIYVDPKAEWPQIYAEAWRIERDFFYDPHHHGLDLEAAKKLYQPFLAGVASREDLNVLFREMTGWMDVGHVFVGGGAPKLDNHIPIGLLGADYTVENGHFRIARIYSGENWNPKLRAPLTQPGIHAAVGEYILAVNGTEVAATDEFYRFFAETADRQTAVLLGPNPDGTGAHLETVVPVNSEIELRYRAWIVDNRRKVDALSGGRLAYVHLPDTAAEGFIDFNRYYFSQVGKSGTIVDERFNHGGQIADYVVDLLHRPVLMMSETREGGETPLPQMRIPGPVVMIINQNSGSGGDALPWMFRQAHVGPLVGTRTWGGLVGIGGYPPFIDGGSITAPRWALFGLNGEWNVENRGVPPDIEVEQDPKLVRQGHDPQLEAAVKTALELLAKNPPPVYQTPPYPNYHQKLPASP